MIFYNKDHSPGKRKSFQQMALGKVDIHMQKNEFKPLPHSRTKTKNVKYLNVRATTIKLLEANTG